MDFISACCSGEASRAMLALINLMFGPKSFSRRTALEVAINLYCTPTPSEGISFFSRARNLSAIFEDLFPVPWPTNDSNHHVLCQGYDHRMRCLGSFKLFLLSYIQEKTASLPFGRLGVNHTPRNAGAAGSRTSRVTWWAEIE